MKYFIAITISFFCTITCFGQDRVNREKITFGNSGAILNKVTGWAYNESVGEWIKFDNLLSSWKGDAKYTEERTGTPSRVVMSRRYNNIISLQFKTLTVNDIPYYVLVWEKWTGAYKYPHIKEVWEWWTTKLFMMFTVEDMEKLKNVTNNPITITVPTPSRGRIDTYSSDEDVIQTEMNSNIQLKSSIVIYKATDGSIRFLFQKDLDSLGRTIEKQYFEITEADYLKLLNVDL